MNQHSIVHSILRFILPAAARSSDHMAMAGGGVSARSMAKNCVAVIAAMVMVVVVVMMGAGTNAQSSSIHTTYHWHLDQVPRATHSPSPRASSANVHCNGIDSPSTGPTTASPTPRTRYRRSRTRGSMALDSHRPSYDASLVFVVGAAASSRSVRMAIDAIGTIAGRPPRATAGLDLWRGRSSRRYGIRTNRGSLARACSRTHIGPNRLPVHAVELDQHLPQRAEHGSTSTKLARVRATSVQQRQRQRQRRHSHCVGCQVSYAGSLFENIQSLANNKWGGYNPNFNATYAQVRSLAGTRLDRTRFARR